MNILLIGSILALLSCIIAIVVYTYYKKPTWFKKIATIGAVGVLIGSGAVVIDLLPSLVEPSWVEITSTEYESDCGSSGSPPHTLSEALDGTDYWSHTTTETHWFIIDLGYSTTIQKVRGRSSTVSDPTSVSIYVSTDGSTWGSALYTGNPGWEDHTTWVETDITDKDGRYVKVTISDTESPTGNSLNFGKTTTPYMQIFDVYVMPINYAPTQSNPSPADESTGISLNPQLAITVADVNEDLMNISFYTNATGTWGLIGTNSSQPDGTYRWTNSSMNHYSTIYWWNVSVNDGNNHWTNTTYNFTTIPVTTSVNTITPYNRATQIHPTAEAGILDNITLWYRYSTDNATWGGYGVTTISTITTTENAIHGTCTDGEFIFGTSRGSNKMLKINISTEVVNEYSISNISGIGVSEEADYAIYVSSLDKVYVLGTNDGFQRLIEVDPSISANGQIIERVVFPNNEYPGGLCYAFGYIWAATWSYLYRVNITTWANTTYDYSSYGANSSVGIHNVFNDSTSIWITTGSLQVYNPKLFKVNPDSPAVPTVYEINTNKKAITDDAVVVNGCVYLGVESLPGSNKRFNITTGAVDQTVTIPNSGLCFAIMYYADADVIISFFAYNTTSEKSIIAYLDKDDITSVIFTYEDPYRSPNEFLEIGNYIYIFHWTSPDAYTLSILNGNFGGWMEDDIDTESPWSWTFLFQNDTGYYEFYSIGMVSGDEESPPGICDAMCYYSPMHYNLTIRTDGIDYFIWMDDTDATASTVATFITNLNTVDEYIAIWDSSIVWGSDGIWNKYYGDGSGTDFAVDTFDVIKVYLNDGAGTFVVRMHSDAAIDYSETRVETLTYGVNQGANYIGWSNDDNILASALASTNITTTLDENEQIWWWNNATYSWEYYIVGFIEPVITITPYDVIVVRVNNQETLNIGGTV